MHPVLTNLLTVTAPLTFIPSLGAVNAAAFQGNPSGVISAVNEALRDQRFVVGKVRSDLVSLIDDINDWAGVTQTSQIAA